MPLLMGDVQTGNWEDVKQNFAAIQAWAGTLDRVGNVVNFQATADHFIAGGAGNSWTVAGLPDPGGRFLSYTIINETMLLNIYVPTSTLVASGTAITVVAVKLPAGYKTVGPVVAAGAVGRIYFGTAHMINGGTSFSARLFAHDNSPFVYIEKTSGAVLADDTGFFVQGFIAVPVQPA